VTVTWQAAIGNYPHTEALRSGQVASEQLKLTFVDMPTINRAFAPMVRESRFDVCEMAVATFLQAQAYAKPLVLLPVTLAARFQQSALLCRADSRIRGPADLPGSRVGVRAYSQTTGMWLRGILADDYGIQPGQIRWVTFEDAHVHEYQDPPWAERAPPGSDLLSMLRANELDAIIVGNDVPGDPNLRPVFPDAAASAKRFWDSNGFVPVNHLVSIRREHAEFHPDLVAELVTMFRAAKDAAGPPAFPDRYLIGREPLQPVIELALRYAAEQGLLPCELKLAEVWDGGAVA
jgi:4,5-dihydroxyphthalate decarboxylase